MRIILSVLILVFFITTIIVARGTLNLPILEKINNQIVTQDLPKLYPYPVKIENASPPPEITATSAIVIDVKTGITLFEKDPNVRHLPASTTKLMTAIVALEKCLPKQIVKVGPFPQEGTQMGLASGDFVTVETLLNGMLIASGNDAAYTLANSCEKSYPQFIVSMNQKAKELQMENTHFENPAGFDSDLQYSTAKDLAKLAKVAVANPLIAKIVATQRTVLTDLSGNKTYYVENVNKLLGQVEGIEGVKTGQTEGSLEILLTKTTRENNTIIVAVLASHDRFGESKNLIEWTFANHKWFSPN